MSKLVIAEKPSVGKSIASVLGADKRQDGFCEGNGYVVTWCFGFLSEFSEPEAYDEKYGKWRFDDLPIRPDVWQYTVMRDKKQQLDRIAALANRSDVTELVNACDAGREGERIFRNVYALIHCSKPVSRLWISSMEDEAIRRGFDDLKPGSDYDNLSFAADCRAKADWLVGINATRLFSVLYHRTLNVGRVMSPTLALIVQREAEIDGFKAEPFYIVDLDFGDYRAASEKFKAKETAEELLRKCEGQAAVVRSVEQKEKTEKAPALYDLTTLQRDANRILGFTAQQTLDYVQALYEKKRCTYPRTDSRYLTDDMERTVPAIALNASLICNLSIPSPHITGQICNSKKVSDHHAIVPTTGSAKVGLDELPAGELEILKLIARRVLVSLSEAHQYLETTVVMDCGDSTFTAKGKQVLSPGWRQNEKPEDNSSALPDISEGMELSFVDAALKEGKTTPPKRYTEDTLLAAMETAGSKEMPEDAERKGLGTPATRAETLEKLVSTGFVERKKNKKSISLVPSHSGISLVTVLPEQLQSPLLTAEWEYRLKEVERGELPPEQFLDGISDMVATLVQTYQPVLGAEVLFPSGRTVVGKCPRCGSDVTESKKGYFCERNDCRFGLWRDNRFLAGKKINLNKKVVSTLLKDGRTFISGIYSERTGKNFDADLLMLNTDNTEAMAFDAEEIRSHDGFFGVSREDWEAAKMGFEPEVDRPDYEKSFLDGKEDGFLLLQLKDIPETRDFRFMDMEYLRQKEMQVSHDNYGAVYSGSLPPGTDSRDALDNIYTRFNIDRPQDFTGHSLSVSDIIVLRQQGRVSCHYVDSWGFKELPQFLPENYLKNAEMAMEDDYGMIDGIINNGKSPARVEQERQTDERPSVLEKLRSYSTQERTEVPKKNAPSRGAEREI